MATEAIGRSDASGEVSGALELSDNICAPIRLGHDPIRMRTRQNVLSQNLSQHQVSLAVRVATKDCDTARGLVSRVWPWQKSRFSLLLVHLQDLTVTQVC